jgi:hypothetical protein
MKKLLRSQMKQVLGGLGAEIDDDESGNCKCSKGKAGLSDTCSVTTDDCERKCKCDYVCKDQGSEKGSICKAR